MEGVGPDGRMYLLSRPPEEEQINTLWKLYFQAERDKESLKAKLSYQVCAILVYGSYLINVMCLLV